MTSARPIRKARNVLLVPMALLAIGSPLFAQIDISGSWSSYNDSDPLSQNPGPRWYPLDFLGVPLNAMGKQRGYLYEGEENSEPERICGFYPQLYLPIGPHGLKIWNETEPRNGTTIAWHLNSWEDRPEMTIWMDGRPHPSKYAPHPAEGFATGTWENDVLVVYVTHMKAWQVRKNGAPSTDEATMLTRFFRHGNELTVTSRIDEPTYLTEPYYLTKTYVQDGVAAMLSVGAPCIQGDEGVPEEKVPHTLPGKNPAVGEFQKIYNIPTEATMGGAETMYPEYRKKLKDNYKVPEKCPRNCGGPGVDVRR